jgi:hypothetical protein
MALVPTYLRLEAPEGIEEYRIYNGDIEVRQLQYPVEEDRLWYRLTTEELASHVNQNTVVAQWLMRRLGWRRLLRACGTEQNLSFAKIWHHTTEERHAA